MILPLIRNREIYLPITLNFDYVLRNYLYNVCEWIGLKLKPNLAHFCMILFDICRGILIVSHTFNWEDEWLISCSINFFLCKLVKSPVDRSQSFNLIKFGATLNWNSFTFLHYCNQHNFNPTFNPVHSLCSPNNWSKIDTSISEAMGMLLGLQPHNQKY